MIQSNNIVKKVKSGDLNSFRELFDNWKTPIYNFVSKMIGNLTDAEDITQEVFLIVYNKIHTLKKDEFFKSWIFTIAKNSTLNWITKNAQQNRSLSYDTNYPVSNNMSPEETLMSQDFEELIKVNLNKMSHDCKLAFVLRMFNELEYKEIASITGWPLSKVKTTIHRARLFMRDRLKPFVKEYTL